jgi:hypothetical protein
MLANIKAPATANIKAAPVFTPEHQHFLLRNSGDVRD